MCTSHARMFSHVIPCNHSFGSVTWRVRILLLNRLADDDIVLAYATHPTWRDIPGSACISDTGSTSERLPSTCLRAKGSSLWTWGFQPDRKFATFNRQRAQFSCEDIGEQPVADQVASNNAEPCTSVLRWRCAARREAESQPSDYTIELFKSQTLQINQMMLGSIVRGDERILLRCPGDNNLSVPLITDVHRPRLVRPGDFVLACASAPYLIQPQVSPKRQHTDVQR